MIKEELKKIDIPTLIEHLSIKGHSVAAIKAAFKRGSIPKSMAADMEYLTSKSALFWLMPDKYSPDGSRKNNALATD